MKPKQIYYHIQKIENVNPEWFPGDEYFIDPDELNYFHKGLLSGLGVTKNNDKEESIRLIKHVGELLKGNVDNYKLYCTCEDLKTSLQQYIKWIQEDIFEKVRLLNYPNLPSRKSCIWLCTFDQIENWIDIIGNTKARYQQPKIKILSLLVEGICHEADGLFIDADTYKIEDFETAANNYWSGKNKSDQEIEILFQGKVTILNEFKSINEINKEI